MSLLYGNLNPGAGQHLPLYRGGWEELVGASIDPGQTPPTLETSIAMAFFAQIARSGQFDLVSRADPPRGGGCSSNTRRPSASVFGASREFCA